jgi:hypothetical protein
MKTGKLNHDKTDRKKCASWVGIGKDLWIDPSYPLSQLNHSCNPNIGQRGKIRFYALRDIRKGEEMTFDYSTSEAETDWTMKCHCGSKKCRKTITSIQFLPENIYSDYLPYIPTYFQKVYNRYLLSPHSNTMPQASDGVL